MSAAPYRLVTLLEMLEIKAEAFWRLASLIGQLLVRLETSLPPINEIAASLGELRREAERLGVRSVVLQLDRINDLVRGGQWSGIETLGGLLRPLVKDLHFRMLDELGDRFFLAIPAEKVSYFRPSEPLFGREVEMKFPSALFEIDEAGKCFAVGRYTATVFHLMRVMEINIRAMARCLQIPDPIKPAERNWGYILNEIKKNGIDARWPTSASRTHGDGALFEGPLASLDAVKTLGETPQCMWKINTQRMRRSTSWMLWGVL